MSTLAALKRPELFRQATLIDGKWIVAKSKQTFKVINPANLAHLADVPEMGAEDTKLAINAASKAFKTFKDTTPRTRARALRKWSDLMLSNIDDLALILTLENGKPLPEARGEVTYAASFLEWFAGAAEQRTHGETVPVANKNQRIVTFKQPIGVAACLAPWNFPLAMITRKAGAAIAAGCTVVVKPAGETPLSCLALAVLAEEAGFEHGVVNVVTTLDSVRSITRLVPAIHSDC